MFEASLTYTVKKKEEERTIKDASATSLIIE
jgi:hypothetical protein